MGVNAAAEIFTVTLKGITEGPNALNISDSTIPMGAPIVLDDQSEPPVDTTPISITVLPASTPEPASIALLAAGIPLILRRRR